MIVWVPMLPEDNAAAARASAGECADSRVDHFYDADQHASRAIAGLLGGVGAVAWDVYLMYARHTRWERTPPLPYAWAHQLRRNAWADPARYHSGSALASELRRTVTHLRSAP